MKNWKNLFVKSEDENDEQKEDSKQNTTEGGFSFPVGNKATIVPNAENATVTNSNANSDTVNEIIKVYENGLDSINMPGYDFYEFYKAIGSVALTNQQTYQMAFQMASSMDNSLTKQKLISDADFYISKINDVHSQYVLQGQGKLSEIQQKKDREKADLNTEIEKNNQELIALRSQIANLENKISTASQQLGNIHSQYAPTENSIREKLTANDLAKQNSIQKLNNVKTGIQTNIN